LKSSFCKETDQRGVPRTAEHARRRLAGGAFENARVEGPRNEPWGYQVTWVHDPSGVLLRFSQPLARPSAS